MIDTAPGAWDSGTIGRRCIVKEGPYYYIAYEGSTEQPYGDARWSSGLITRYEFAVSTNNADWKTVSQGEFSNIKNNPVWQVKEIEPAKARYIRLRALGTTDGNSRTGYAEIDIVTK